ncbi:MAG TPA: choice-of-anchor tandem repeat GloVer-containing protein [Terriglobia bacterium]|nr:choice-of-anchor tandem repeat GloVer-containing protein [Terriglobia bacterium]
MTNTQGNRGWAAMMVAATLMMLAAAIAAPAQSAPFISLHGFDLTDGANPYAALIQAADGNLYGTTGAGGGLGSCAPGGCGTVFRITLSGTLTTLHNFCSQSACADGASPEAALVQAIDGNFYGTTTAGGASGIGTVFKISPIGTLTTLHSFDGTDGSNPYGPLVQAKDGNFYGTTAFGGANDWGTVFKMSPSGILTTLYSFCSQSGCTDGSEPLAGVVQGKDGTSTGQPSWAGPEAAERSSR